MTSLKCSAMVVRRTFIVAVTSPASAENSRPSTVNLLIRSKGASPEFLQPASNRKEVAEDLPFVRSQAQTHRLPDGREVFGTPGSDDRSSHLRVRHHPCQRQASHTDAAALGFAAQAVERLKRPRRGICQVWVGTQGHA